ncbi:MAG: hypothetical protein HS104_06870 [Polyangiaceae bacterium]|nr:hypothetical protein [Polyangiaceae bacterium]
MIAELIEARRRRVALEDRVARLRQLVDVELGTIASELHAIERLEREGARAMRELEPELNAE